MLELRLNPAREPRVGAAPKKTWGMNKWVDLMVVLAAADSRTMRIVSILALSALLAGATKAEDYYKLPGIEWIGKNLYQSTKVIIETCACLHLPVDDEDALLKYVGPGQYES